MYNYSWIKCCQNRNLTISALGRAALVKLVYRTYSRRKNKKSWRCRGSNPGPFTCKANALPLSYIPIFIKQCCMSYLWSFSCKINSPFENFYIYLFTQYSEKYNISDQEIVEGRVAGDLYFCIIRELIIQVSGPQGTNICFTYMASKYQIYSIFLNDCSAGKRHPLPRQTQFPWPYLLLQLEYILSFQDHEEPPEKYLRVCQVCR